MQEIIKSRNSRKIVKVVTAAVVTATEKRAPFSSDFDN